jgi:hypothetical protein
LQGTDHRGRTPAHIAASHGQVLIIRLEKLPCIKLARSFLEHGREAHLLLMDVRLIKIDFSFLLIP